MTAAELQARVDALAPWYHDIDLGQGVRTVGWQGIAHVWAHIRKVRAAIAAEYVGATVFDLGSWDGGWAFEAEMLGARNVLACELGVEKRLEHFLFAREARGSRVLPCYGADAERIDEFTAQYMVEHGKADIVQHCGLLYHLKNPIRSIEATRRVIKTGGLLLLETAGAKDERAVMLSNRGSGVYVDPWTFWAPTPDALIYMLGLGGFDVLTETVSVLDDAVPRIALIARAE